MDRAMHLWQFGHFGMPVLVFPSAGGMAHEWDAHGMIDALSDLIDGGKIKIYHTETNVAEAWTRSEGDPSWRIAQHRRFEAYVLHELVPFIREDCRTADIPIVTTGTSLGALYTVNAVLKHPEVFPWGLGLSGLYDVRRFTDGFDSADVYFNNPLAYLPGLDGADLERVRSAARLTIVCGQGRWEDGNIEEAKQLAALLATKRIPHELDLWGYDVDHAWVWWQRQARYHLGRRFG
jgi:esterase/lipase superfamily enzyme